MWSLTITRFINNQFKTIKAISNNSQASSRRLVSTRSQRLSSRCTRIRSTTTKRKSNKTTLKTFSMKCCSKTARADVSTMTSDRLSYFNYIHKVALKFERKCSLSYRDYLLVCAGGQCRKARPFLIIVRYFESNVVAQICRGAREKTDRGWHLRITLT